MQNYNYNQYYQNLIPPEFQNLLMPDEQVLAVTQKHPLWFVGWWLNPFNIMIVLFIFGIFVFLYQAYIIKYEILILTNRRIIGSVNPGLFTKDKIDLMFKAVDNIQEDESFLGNLFGWSKLVIESRSASYPLSQVTKESVRYFKERFYEQLRLINQV
jgi:uncharacterized membrane protein YdbT with pleckstrin-like domain